MGIQDVIGGHLSFEKRFDHSHKFDPPLTLAESGRLVGRRLSSDSDKSLTTSRGRDNNFIESVVDKIRDTKQYVGIFFVFGF